MMDWRKKIQNIILKVLKFELKVTGAIPVKITTSHIEISHPLRVNCYFLLVLSCVGIIAYCSNWITDSSQRNFGAYMAGLAIINMFVYSIGSYLVVCTKSQQITSSLNRLINRTR